MPRPDKAGRWFIFTHDEMRAALATANSCLGRDVTFKSRSDERGNQCFVFDGWVYLGKTKDGKGWRVWVAMPDEAFCRDVPCIRMSEGSDRPYRTLECAMVGVLTHLIHLETHRQFRALAEPRAGNIRHADPSMS